MKKGIESVGFVRRCYILLSVTFVIFIMSHGTATSQESGWTGNVNVFLGAKALDEDDWYPVEEQGEFGVQIDFRPRSWPVNLVIDLLGAYGEDDSLGVKVESITSEFNIGVRKIWEQFAYTRPFIGGGLSFINGEFSVEAFDIKVTDDDQGAGLWLGGGVYWTIGHFNIGLELKASAAEITLFGIDVNAGGGHFGMLIGGHW
ncbi:MAG: hypothetical protein JSU92_11955 [Deltaproteobacteria bacterium]|nr:MAG: hypothetical protein JSU92_11955 [Deltaproteobacteria bacterium]